MTHDRQETSRIWWSGTLNGAAKGLLMGAAMGIAAAFALSGIVAAFPVIAPVFGGFLTLGSGFSVIPLVIFNGVLGALGGAFNAGNAAVGAHKDAEINRLQDQKIAALERYEMLAHGKAIEQPQHAQPQHTARPSTTVVAADAEISRLQNAPSSRALH